MHITFRIGGYFMMIALFSACLSRNTEVSFNRDIRPILNNKCMSCHGGVKQQGNVSFLFESSFYQETQLGNFPVVRGKPLQSEMFNRITHENPELRMPQEGAPLDDKEVALIHKWIKQGAAWEEHWAFISPVSSIPIPKSPWGDQPIDHFVWNKMQEKKLSPSSEASAEILLRRLYLDLIGLPPSIEVVNRYINNNSADKYEMVVNQLLGSKHFGEKWASMWLDLSRYADSQGFQKDKIRPTMWLYRDWVIKALNDDMPFDQFTIEQLAGDLLPDYTDQQLLATAFHRNTMTNDEGGTDDEEYRVQAVLDRTNTTMEIWQGITFSCVQCHSHPYDPIPHREYFELMSYFNNTQDHDHYSEQPTASLISEAQKELRDSLEKLSDEKRAMINPAVLAFTREMLIPIMQEMPKDSSRNTHVFVRGNWLMPGDEVQPNVPKALNKTDRTFEPNRLGLAQWLVDKNNPLTARVIVNRIWQQIFGMGIVETLEDFGSQGSKPSHPDLLDYLAIQFMHEHNWSIKEMVKEIVLSATYRQDSDLSPDKIAIDPENIYLSHGPRVRLSAEQIRDQALAVSDLLNPQVYGPSVMPYQPEGVWNVIRHVAQWKTGEAGQQYRRALYTFWRRVSPYPAMLIFDTPSRELCVSRRVNTNTPLQALNLLNDPVYVEAAMALSNLALDKYPLNQTDQIRYAYRKTTCQQLSDSKEIILQSQYDKMYQVYQNEPELLASLSPDETVFSIEYAALFSVCQTILNLDETIMKK